MNPQGARSDGPLSRGELIAFVGIVLCAAVLRFWALDLGLPHLMTRPDEEVILFQAGSPAAGRFDLKYGIYPSAYIYLTWLWGEIGLRALRLVGLFPSGNYTTLLLREPARLLLLDRALSAVAGVLTVVLLVVFARRNLGRCAALLAGALLATDFIHARDSHAAKPDVLMSLGVVAAIGLMAPLARRATWQRGALVGAVVGLAMGMKYPAVLLLLPAYVAAVMGSQARGWRRILPGSAIAAGLAAAVTFLATSPDLFFNPETRNKVLSIVVLVFPQAFPHVTDTGAVPQGRVDIPTAPSFWAGYAYHAGFSLRYGIGLLPTLLTPLALLWGLASRRPIAVLSTVCAVSYFLVVGASPALLARYMTPIVPLLLLLIAGMTVAVSRRFGAARARGAFLVVATLVLVSEPLASIVAHDTIAARTDTRVQATEWLARNVPPGSRVAMVGTEFWGYGEPTAPPGIDMVRSKLDAASLDATGARWVVAHDHPLFSSRVDPQALAAMAPRLKLVAEFDPFTGPRDTAIFEPADAYYIPTHGFGAVSRPGPHVRIYELLPATPG
jgi:hypothetical protein